MRLEEEVAEALVEVGQVRVSISDPEERAAEAASRILDGYEAAVLDAWRGYRARPSRLSERAVRRALHRWRSVWLYGIWSD